MAIQIPFTPVFAHWSRTPAYEREDMIREDIDSHQRVIKALEKALNSAKGNSLAEAQVSIDSIDWTLGDVLESLIFNLNEDLKALRAL